MPALPQSTDSRLPHVQRVQVVLLVASLLSGALLGAAVTWTQLRPSAHAPASGHSTWCSGAGSFAAAATVQEPQRNASDTTAASPPINLDTDAIRGHSAAGHVHAAGNRAHSSHNMTGTIGGMPYEHVQHLLTRLGHNLQLSSVQQLRLDMQRIRLYLSSHAFKQQQQQQKEKQRQQRSPSRGILITAGGRDMLANALITIRVLREVLNCTLPVEVVHFGALEREPAAAQLLEAYNSSSGGGISLLDGVPRQPLPLHRKHASIEGFGHKVYALCFVTTFDQVLLLDADSMPLSNPARLFQAPAFVEHGSLFWPDFWHNAWVKPQLYTEFDMAVPWQHDPQHHLTDSGQLLLDRRRHAGVLEWAWFLNSHQEVVYKHMHGDKDTYKIAFHLAGKARRFAQVQHPARDAMTEVEQSSSSKSSKHGFHHLGMLQAGLDGAPAFLHRTSFNAKFIPHCLHQPAKYCQVQWVSVPLTDQQAQRSLKPNMYAFNADEVDTTAFLTACSNVSLPVPDLHCNFTGGQMPIPVIPVQRFEGITPVLEASYHIFAEIRAALGAKRRR